MNYDKKEKVIFSHFKDMLEYAQFDEYDIIGFLILIRRHLKKDSYPILHDFCDLIAHRQRNQGLILRAIGIAIENKYTTLLNIKTIKDYKGININDLHNEWIKLGENFDINIGNKILLDLDLCLFSLVQFTTYKYKDYLGRIELFQSKDNYLALCTTDGSNNSPLVCFAKCGPFVFSNKFAGGWITNPVETIRENDRLRLKDNTNYII